MAACHLPCLAAHCETARAIGRLDNGLPLPAKRADVKDTK
jgi:hypothetical protein